MGDNADIAFPLLFQETLMSGASAPTDIRKHHHSQLKPRLKSESHIVPFGEKSLSLSKKLLNWAIAKSRIRDGG